MNKYIFIADNSLNAVKSLLELLHEDAHLICVNQNTELSAPEIREYQEKGYQLITQQDYLSSDSQLTYRRSDFSKAAKISIYSSGSSGKPALYTFSLNQLFDYNKKFIDAFLGRYEQKSPFQSVLFAPLSSIAGINLCLRSVLLEIPIFASGIKIQDVTASDHSLFNDALISLFPKQLAILASKNIKILSALKDCHTILLGGSELHESHKKIIRDFQLDNVYETYALSECGGTVAFRKYPEKSYQTFASNEFSLADNCLAIKPALIAEEIKQNNLYITSDYAELNEEGEIRKIFRSDRIACIASKNVNLDDLENQLLKSNLLHEVVCLKRVNAQQEDEIIAFYVEKTTDLQDCLAKLHFPVISFRKVKSIPYLENNKVDYSFLRDLLL